MKVETVEVKGPAGRVVINKSDLSAYQARGYRLLCEEDVDAVEDVEPDEEDIETGEE